MKGETKSSLWNTNKRGWGMRMCGEANLRFSSTPPTFP
jgi:hypothetical protein